MANVELDNDLMVSKLIDQKKIESVVCEMARRSVIIEIPQDKLQEQFKLRNVMKSLLNLSYKGKLDIESLVQYLNGAYQAFNSAHITRETEVDIQAAGLTKQDEFGQSIAEIICLLNAEQGDSSFTDFTSKLLPSLWEQGILSHREVLEQFDMDLLIKCAIVNKTIFDNKTNGFKIKNFFDQRKFNLQREENEGYAKLIIEVTQANINSENWKTVMLNISQLVGFFSLDPTRVLDMLLTAFQCNLANLTYLKLVSDFGSKEAVTQLIGFKIKTQKSISVEETANLFNLIAILMKHQVIEISEIWSYFEPEKQDEIIDLLKRQQTSLEYQYAMLFKTIMNKDSYAKELKTKKVEQDSITVERSRLSSENQKLKLLKACIDINDWSTADIIVNCMYEGKLDLTLSRPLLDSIFNALQWFIQPLFKLTKGQSSGLLTARFTANSPFAINQSSYQYYKSDSESEFDCEIKQASNPKELHEGLLKIIRILGIYIAFDEKAFLKLLQVLHANMNETPEHHMQTIQMTGEIFLPALAVTSCNYPLENALWAVLKQATAVDRYNFYSMLTKKGYLSQPCLLAAFIQAYNQVKSWSRRLSTVDTVMKQMTKELYKVCSGNAIPVFDLFVVNTKTFDNQIEPQLQAISHCQELTLDIAAFTITKNLADNFESPIMTNGDIVPWFKNQVEFASSFFKKFPSVDMEGFFSYLLKKMKNDNDFTLGYIIHSVIVKMFGWTDHCINQLKASELQLLASGLVLQTEGKNQSQFKKNKNSCDALVQMLWENPEMKSLAFQAMVTLGQQAQHLLQEHQSEELLLVARHYDKMQVYFLHFVDTINFLAQSGGSQKVNISPDQRFDQLMPVNAQKLLAYDFDLPTQYCFQIIRGSLAPIHKLQNEQFDQISNNFSDILNLNLKRKVEIAQTNEDAIDNDYWDEEKYINDRKETIWRHMSPEIYCIFWYMSLQNLVVPTKFYQEEVDRISKQIATLQTQATSSAATYSRTNVINTSGANATTPAQKENLKEIAKLQKLQKALNHEQETLSNNKTNTMNFLKEKLPDLFQKCFDNKPQSSIKGLAEVLIQHCFFPRLMHSARDALYTFNFFKILHQLRLKNFSIIHILTGILKQIVPAIHFCSEEEAENLGVFLSELFGLLNHWNTRVNWDKECDGQAAFAQKPGGTSIQFEEFGRVQNSFAQQLARKLVQCLEPTPGMFMKAKCSLLILNRMSKVFPNALTIAETIQTNLQKLIESKHDTQRGVLDLARIVNDNLKKKISSFPEFQKRAKDEEARLANQNSRTVQSVSKPSTSSRPAPARTSTTSKEPIEANSKPTSTEKKDSDRPRQSVISQDRDREKSSSAPKTQNSKASPQTLVGGSRTHTEMTIKDHGSEKVDKDLPEKAQNNRPRKEVQPGRVVNNITERPSQPDKRPKFASPESGKAIHVQAKQTIAYQGSPNEHANNGKRTTAPISQSGGKSTPSSEKATASNILTVQSSKGKTVTIEKATEKERDQTRPAQVQKESRPSPADNGFRDSVGQGRNRVDSGNMKSQLQPPVHSGARPVNPGAPHRASPGRGSYAGPGGRNQQSGYFNEGRTGGPGGHPPPGERGNARGNPRQQANYDMYESGPPPHRADDYRNNREPDHRRPPPIDDQFYHGANGRGRRDRDDRDREMRDKDTQNNRRY